MQLPLNHPLFIFEKNINKACKSLFSKYDLSEFSYIKVFRDGRFVHLDTNPEFANEYYRLGIYPNLDELVSNNRSYVLLSVNINDPFISYQKEKLISNLNLAKNHNLFHRLYLIKNKLDYFELFGFGTNKNNINMIDYLLLNINTFNKFSLYVKNDLHKIIQEAEECRIKLFDFIQINGSDNSDKQAITNDNFSLKNYMINNKRISFREIQCLTYLSQGLSVKEISKDINLSPKTIEYYIYNLKIKLDCFSKNELIRIYYESDLSDLDNML